MKVTDIPRRIVIFFLKLYRVVISPVLPPSCRFHPTCSEYAMEAITKHGFFKGAVMAISRVLRCNPFFEGGYDPVR